MRRQDWLLSAIAQAGKNGLSPIQIQKTMFLLKMEAADYVGQRFYSFEPYNYGPFSQAIYGDLDRLVESGLVREQQSGNYTIYIATSAGRDSAKTCIRSLEDKPRKYLQKTVNWILSVGLAQLLRSIYAKYPRYASKSVFRD